MVELTIIINQKIDRVNLLFLKRLYREKNPGVRSQNVRQELRSELLTCWIWFETKIEANIFQLLAWTLILVSFTILLLESLFC